MTTVPKLTRQEAAAKVIELLARRGVQAQTAQLLLLIDDLVNLLAPATEMDKIDCPACSITPEEWERMRATAGAEWVLLADIPCTCPRSDDMQPTPSAEELADAIDRWTEENR